MIASAIFDEFTAFLAALRPEQVIAFRPSTQANARYEWLVQREKNEGLTEAERSE